MVIIIVVITNKHEFHPRSVPLLREVPEETLAKIADVLEEVGVFSEYRTSSCASKICRLVSSNTTMPVLIAFHLFPLIRIKS